MLADILRNDLGVPWVEAAVLSSLADGAGDMFVLLASDARFRNDPAGWAFLTQLVTMLGTKGILGEVNQVVDFIPRSSLTLSQTISILADLGEGLHRTRSSLALVDPGNRLQIVYLNALGVLKDDRAEPGYRAEAMRLLTASPWALAETGGWLQILRGPAEPMPLRAAATLALGSFKEPEVTRQLFSGWGTLPAPLRTTTMNALLSRDERVSVVIGALENGSISPADFSSTQMNFLRSYRDAGLRDRALRRLGPVSSRRPAVVAQYAPALRLRGTAERGRQLFLGRCADCHALGGQGNPLGPNLVGAKVKGRERMLSSILEPSAEVASEYAVWVLETKDGENMLGLKQSNNPDAITLALSGGGKVVWPLFNVETAQPQTWSLMPDGLEQGLTTQDLANLLDYLMTVR